MTNPYVPMSEAEFRRTFKVGSVVEGFRFNRQYIITAIGEGKFLGRLVGANHLEKMFPIVNTKAFWRVPRYINTQGDL